MAERAIERPSWYLDNHPLLPMIEDEGGGPEPEFHEWKDRQRGHKEKSCLIPS